ncbi:MAG TPA: TfpX/TfpZ family type IV pilin accessory protein [Burkholderiaceae bacterium]|nr:TfpX/TfpZ family type IV pilin accessory protein [Burkholderiaceae bacterium]
MSNDVPAARSRRLAVRAQAASIHLGASAILATLIVVLIAFVWYPSPYFRLAGGRDLFLLITGCDLVLGPLLTLVIFDVRKPRGELVRDVAVIAMLQLAAMSYGLWTMLQARPAFIVYNVGQFNVALANEIAAENEAGAAPALPWSGPKVVAAKLPDDPRERTRITFSAIEGRGDIFQMPKYYVPYASLVDDIRNHARTAEELAAAMHRPAEDIARAVASASIPAGIDAGYLPLVVRFHTAIAIIDRQTGRFLGAATLQDS